MAREPDDPDEEDPQQRMMVNLLVLILVLVLLGAGFWLIYGLDEARRAQDCLSAGLRQCSARQRLTF